MSSKPLLRRYGLALIYTGFCTGLVSLFPKLFPGNTPFLLFGAATAIAAGYGGIGPGLVATALSAAAADFFAVRPIHVWKVDALYQPPIAVFIFIALIVTAIAEILRAAYIRAEVALKEAEHERNRAGFLSDASVVMDESLDLGVTLTSVARLVVPRFTDWCAIDLVDESDPNTMHQVAAAHVESGKEELVRQLQTRYPLDSNGRHPVRFALQSGRPDVHQNITDAELVSQARDSEQLKLLRELRIRSYMCVPMKARGQALGTIFFGSGANKRFTPVDLKLAQDLAHRAALAVDNARLYREARDEIAERKRTEETLVRNQEHVAALNQRLRRSMIETHHRVKNNLQIIAAMVDMLLMDEQDSVSSDELRRLSGHIRALAAVHDILTMKSRDEGETDVVSARAVLDKLLGLMEGTSQGRRIVSSLAEQDLPAKQSTSLALITNELVSNAIKYGKGDIQVKLFRENGHAVLEVCDDGPGFPDGFDPVKAANTGLDLVESLSKWDLSGQTYYECRPEGGARVAVQIPLKA